MFHPKQVPLTSSRTEIAGDMRAGGRPFTKAFFNFHRRGRPTMPKRKTIPFTRSAQKEEWNLYGLQSLQPDRFARVVDRILDGRYLVFRPSPPPRLTV